MTTTLTHQDPKERDNHIQDALSKFHALTSNYVFGKVSTSCVDSGLSLHRPSLLKAL